MAVAVEFDEFLGGFLFSLVNLSGWVVRVPIAWAVLETLVALFELGAQVDGLLDDWVHVVLLCCLEYEISIGVPCVHLKGVPRDHVFVTCGQG